MVKGLLNRTIPCPGCYGNVPLLTSRCPHCDAPISGADRFNWLSESAKAAFFGGTVIAVFVTGWVLLNLLGAI